MGGFLSYSIISGLLMTAMYLAYRVLLARDKQHSFNRGVLLTIYAVSFAASPFAFFTGHHAAGTEMPDAAFTGIEAASAVAAPLSRPIWGTALIWIFITGMIVVAVQTAVTRLRLSRVIRHGRKIVREGYTLVLTDNERYAPFSWMRYIVISRSDYNNNCPAIAAHEMKHVACRHWIDLLLAQAVCIVNWFNPVAWLMRDELMLIHEYQADMAVIDGGHDVQEYQMLLIKKAVGARFPSLANSLNHSKLKKRITMMYKTKSGAGRKFKALALVPMLALGLGVAGVPAIRAAVSTISSSEVSVDKDSENPLQGQADAVLKVTNINNDGNTTTVLIKGKSMGNTMSVSGGTFTNNGKTYRANNINFNMTDDDVTISVGFPFSEDYKDASMCLTVNGREMPFNLESFLADSHAVKIAGSAPKNGTTSSISITGTGSSFPEDLKIFLDGKMITNIEMKKIPPETIASVDVNTEDKTIRINSKK